MRSLDIVCPVFREEEMIELKVAGVLA